MIELGPILDHYDQEFNPDRGGNQQVRCVFHDDRHASASVNLDEGVFNCFTCGIGGDAIELIKIQEGVGFGEAKRLAEELAGKDSSEVPRVSDSGSGFLPRKQGHRQRGKGYVSPWARKRA